MHSRDCCHKFIFCLSMVIVMFIMVFNYLQPSLQPASIPFVLDEIPVYDGRPSVEINHGQPYFLPFEDWHTHVDSFSSLDALHRAGSAFVMISADTLCTDQRTERNLQRPTGWHTVRYDDLIPDKYLYNRCHLIARELYGEKDELENLITGTRYFNVEGMLPYENQIFQYVRKTQNHVLYRVTPIYHEQDLLAAGVLMEAWSCEDQGQGLTLCVYCHNAQPFIKIDYATGQSRRAENQAG